MVGCITVEFADGGVGAPLGKSEVAFDAASEGAFVDGASEGTNVGDRVGDDVDGDNDGRFVGTSLVEGD